ncbi:GspH/FimT family pseudopilin [Hydrogenophaga soli]
MKCLRTPSSQPSVRHRFTAGFTLIELMVTIAVLAILMAIAVPSMQDLIRSNSMRNLGNDFTLSIQRARGEAMAQNQCVALCKSADPTAAIPVCDTANDDWARGWIAYRTPTCNAPTSAAQVNNDRATLLFIQEPFAPSFRIMTTNSVRSIVFTPRGMTSLGNAGQFNVSDTNASSAKNTQYGRTVCVDMVGRTRNITFLANC